MSAQYSSQWFEELAPGARSSAATIVPMIVEMVHPRSVVDVGCGIGAWLAAFRQGGVERTLGLDGAYVPAQKLEIPHSSFVPTDLTKPFTVGEVFDLAVSLEVAEHLPETGADDFVKSIVALAPVCLFSAAIPFQPGRGHLNGQWPTYWAGKFAAHGFECLDCLRRKIWDSPDVEWWYAQNILLFVRRDRVSLVNAPAGTAAAPEDLVHPALYENLMNPAALMLGGALRNAFAALLYRLVHLRSPAASRTRASFRGFAKRR